MKIQNSATGKKEEFIPIKEGEVRIYACGPTVYNFFHIGNARPFIVFDTLRRYLEFRGYKVTFVQNFTDVDDKMIKAAAEQNISVKQLADNFIAEYFADAKALNIKQATFHPRATEHIDEIVSLIQTLIAKGHAYLADGDVYYDTRSFKDYGKLSGQTLEELAVGVRKDLMENKKHPTDFALWKAKKEGEIFWESPFSQGRPGWHIECSAMSMKYLGDTIDIHGGGQDLKFPHHENEVAQSEGATGKKFANYWMHNGYINVDNKKMSKSEGNFFTVRDILQKYDGLVIRLFMLSSHYATPINFSDELLASSAKGLERIYNCLQNLEYTEANPTDIQTDIKTPIAKLKAEFISAMDDDLNTAEAIGVIYEYIKEINTLFANGATKSDAKEGLDALTAHLDVLGLIRKKEEIPQNIKELAEKRRDARANKDFALADKIRDEITALGYEIKDTKDGVKINRL